MLLARRRPVLPGASLSRADSVASQVGSAWLFLNLSSSSSVLRLILIHALLGKWTSMASRQVVSGSRYCASLLHGTCWTASLPSAEPNTVPLNNSSSGISPSSRPAKYLVEPISRS